MLAHPSAHRRQQLHAAWDNHSDHQTLYRREEREGGDISVATEPNKSIAKSKYFAFGVHGIDEKPWAWIRPVSQQIHSGVFLIQGINLLSVFYPPGTITQSYLCGYIPPLEAGLLTLKVSTASQGQDLCDLIQRQQNDSSGS